MEQGYILTSEIDGTIQMKSYLTGSPEIRLALNEDLSIGRNSSSVYGETKPSLLAADYIVALFSLKLQVCIFCNISCLTDILGLAEIYL